MGPAAGADFVRLFVHACDEYLKHHRLPVVDQAYPEHWLAQLPVPDRTAAIAAPDNAAISPLEPLAKGLGQLQALGATSVAIACNTAHYWHAALQQRCPGVRLLHIVEEVVAALRQPDDAGGPANQVLLLATQGTYRSGLYDGALAQAGITVHKPTPEEREQLMRGIFDGVKRGDMAVANHFFGPVLQALRARHGDCPVVMACTEIPLALPQAPEARGLRLIDPARVLAQALARRAYGDAGSDGVATVATGEAAGAAH